MSGLRVFRIDRLALARAFDRASSGYDAAATLQRAVREELFERLQYFRLEPRCVVDLGTGTGEAAVMLRRRYAASQVIAVDLAPGMLREAGRRMRFWRRFSRVCADAHRLPLASARVDLVFCNLMLQWCDEPAAVFAEMRRVLRPGGLLMFSTFGPDTLRELRSAWSKADGLPHVSEFVDMPLLGAALMHSGFVEPVMDLERRVVHYRDVRALAHELRTIGAHNVATDRQRGLTGRQRWQRMEEQYAALRGAAGVPATYEVIYGAAFAAQRPAEPATGEQRIAADSLRRRQRDGDP